MPLKRLQSTTGYGPGRRRRDDLLPFWVRYILWFIVCVGAGVFLWRLIELGVAG